MQEGIKIIESNKQKLAKLIDALYIIDLAERYPNNFDLGNHVRKYIEACKKLID